MSLVFSNNYYQPDPAQQPNEMPKDMGMTTGYLIVHVQTKDGKSLRDAIVEILRETDGKLMVKLSTDSNGNTRKVPLPTPSSQYSAVKESVYVPFSTYIIRVSYPGYMTHIYEHIQVFPETTTTQNSIMMVTKKKEEEMRYRFPHQPL